MSEYSGGTLRKRCYHLNPQLIDGLIHCDTWMPAEDIPAGLLVRDDCEGVEAQFALADVLDTVLDDHRYPDGRIDAGQRALLDAMRAELLAMAEKIAGVQYTDS